MAESPGRAHKYIQRHVVAATDGAEPDERVLARREDVPDVCAPRAAAGVVRGGRRSACVARVDEVKGGDHDGVGYIVVRRRVWGRKDVEQEPLASPGDIAGHHREDIQPRLQRDVGIEVAASDAVMIAPDEHPVNEEVVVVVDHHDDIRGRRSIQGKGLAHEDRLELLGILSPDRLR